MNRLERIVYDLLKSRPWLKIVVRNIYQKAFDLMPRKKEFLLHRLIFKEDYFYGFHDTVPFSKDNSKILANKLNFDLTMPTKGDSIKVGYFPFDGDKMGEFIALGETRSWNYHKGCRAQWLNAHEFIYNIADNANVLKSEIINIDTKEKRRIHYPIDSASSDGRLAASFSYERLQRFMRGYGYVFEDEYSFLDQKAPEGTGLYLIDLQNSSRKLLVSLKELAETSKDEELSSQGHHYVTHSMFSYDIKYISFLHRWVGADTRRRFTRLVIYNLEDRTFKTLPTGYMVSHYVWNTKHEIIAYCNFEGTDSHVLLNVDDFSTNKKVAYPELNSDGHQSFINDTSFITDSYPDKHRKSKLYKVDIPSNKVTLLASVYSPKKFQTTRKKGHIACDLHPTVSFNGRFLCFDTVRTGKRSIAVMVIG